MKSALVVVSIVVGTAQVALAAPRVDTQGRLIRDEHSCGTTRTPAPVDVVGLFAAPASGPRTIYLNRFGGTYNIASSATNAATNTANVIASGDGRAHAGAVIPPIESTFNWPYIVECVKTHYKPYNVIITETEPTAGSYVEAVVGGDGASTGWSASSGILGVASADNFCGVTERGIAFSFSTNHRGISRPNDELCATIAHEVGHLLGLEHEIASTDTMSYVPFATAGAKSFLNTNSQCGTDSSNTNNCSCTTSGAGQVTNSGMRLTQFLGLRPIETVPPSLAVTAPGDGNTLRPSFTVTATASDETAMDQVAVLLDGQVAGASTMPDGTTYAIGLANVTEGQHTLEVQAIDLAGNVTRKSLAITVALGATGETCAINADCHANICATLSSGDSFCTQLCDDANACPDGFACESAGAQQVCVPSSDGGCAVGGNGGGGGRVPVIVLLALGSLLVLRRRPRA